MNESQIKQVNGRALVLRGNDIDTDRVIPARFLKTITFEGLERGLFFDDRQALLNAEQRHPFDRPEFAGASILVVNKNFGCGSSREHAPQALQRWGIRAVVGESFAEIFFSNSLMIGLPCVTMAESDVLAMMEAIEAAPTESGVVDLEQQKASFASRSWTALMPVHVQHALVSGQWDGAGLLLDRYEEVEAAAARLPY